MESSLGRGGRRICALACRGAMPGTPRVGCIACSASWTRCRQRGFTQTIPPKLVRSIEVCLAVGKPMSDALARDPLNGFRILRIGLNPSRQALYERLNQRAEAMFRAGLVEETRGLLARYGPVKALDSLGYRQAAAVLEGTLSEEAAIAAAQQGHRNYAKRQLTWFRHEPEVHWFHSFGDEAGVQRMAKELVALRI